MVWFFLPLCTEQSTLSDLAAMASSTERWKHAHALFQKVRAKNLALSPDDHVLKHQYSFEEICAKTLFNLSDHLPEEGFPPPFDEDSAFCVIPIAVRFARALELKDPFSVVPL